jgi:hypothetical protein
MKCSTHPDVDAVGVCVNCGKAVCPTCSTLIGGKTYCPACAPSVSDVMKRKPTAKPVAGGILGITAGVLGLVLGIILIAGGSATDDYWKSVDWSTVWLGIASVILGILAILGSSFAVSRKNYTFSLIGGVCALLGVWPLGIPALILIAMSRSEFQHVSTGSICVVCGKENPRGARFCMNCSRELPGR